MAGSVGPQEPRPPRRGPDQPKDWDVMRAKAAKLVAAGADVVEEFRQPPQGEWIVMEDPEGNEFCVV